VFASLPLPIPEVLSKSSHNFSVALRQFNSSKLTTELAAYFSVSIDGCIRVGPHGLQAFQFGSIFKDAE
jgi:hypothetical protein